MGEITAWVAILLALPGMIASLPAAGAAIREWLAWLHRRIRSNRDEEE